MYKCMHACFYVNMYIDRQTCINVHFIHMCMFVYMYVYILADKHECPSVPVMHKFPCMFICMCVARNVRAYLFVFACIWNHCNQQCDRKHWYTYFSHNWHLPLTNMSATLHMSFKLHVYHTLHVDPMLLHIAIKWTTKCNFNLPCYCHNCQQYICP